MRLVSDKTTRGRNWYCRFTIARATVRLTVAKAVYEAFIDRVPSGYVVDHVDDDLSNFTPSNLYVRPKMPGDPDKYMKTINRRENRVPRTT